LKMLSTRLLSSSFPHSYFICLRRSWPHFGDFLTYQRVFSQFGASGPMLAVLVPTTSSSFQSVNEIEDGEDVPRADALRRPLIYLLFLDRPHLQGSSVRKSKTFPFPLVDVPNSPFRKGLTVVRQSLKPPSKCGGFMKREKRKKECQFIMRRSLIDFAARSGGRGVRLLPVGHLFLSLVPLSKLRDPGCTR